MFHPPKDALRPTISPARCTACPFVPKSFSAESIAAYGSADSAHRSGTCRDRNKLDSRSPAQQMTPPTRRLGTQIVIIDDRQTIRLHAGSNGRAIPDADRRSNDHRAFAWNGVDSRIEGDLAAIEPEMINHALTRAHELLSQTAGLTDAAAEPEDRDSEGRID